jgi:two-component system, chemotaxis family, chemotaxis protein CheY
MENQATTLCVMVVEDNEHMRTLLRTLLKAMGIRSVFECVDGTEALGAVANVMPDFILTDLSMAPMDGLDFTRSLRRLPDETQCVIPVIMVTAHTERRRIEGARDAGVNEILAKPLTPADLFNRIDRIVNRPRPFVRAEEYSGPCRRRRRKKSYGGPWRRSTDAEHDDTIML